MNVKSAFLFKLFKIVVNQTGLNRGFSLKFWWLRSANSKKFTEECAMCIYRVSQNRSNPII